MAEPGAPFSSTPDPTLSPVLSSNVIPEHQVALTTTTVTTGAQGAGKPH